MNLIQAGKPTNTMVLGVSITKFPKTLHFHVPGAPGLEILDPCTAILRLEGSQALGQAELQGQNGP